MMNDREREAQEFREKFFGNIRKINKVLEEREQEEKKAKQSKDDDDLER